MKKINFFETEISFEHLSNKQIRIAFYLFFFMRSKFLVALASNLLLFFSKLKLPIWFFIHKTLYQHFCGGENTSDLSLIANTCAKKGVGLCYSYSVEGSSEFDKNLEDIIKNNLAIIDLCSKDKNRQKNEFRGAG